MVQVLFPDLNDSITAKVSYASRSIDPLTRTFQVEVKLDNRKEYHPNMVARLRINDYVSAQPVIVVPVKYVQKGLEESYVFVVENGRVHKRVIAVGREYAGLAEVKSGLSAGEQLITGGYDLVNEGDTVSTAAAGPEKE
jgi:multidrug efflux pump subunit AcrA (membrane-fusion protein)